MDTKKDIQRERSSLIPQFRTRDCSWIACWLACDRRWAVLKIANILLSLVLKACVCVLKIVGGHRHRESEWPVPAVTYLLGPHAVSRLIFHNVSQRHLVSVLISSHDL